MEVRELLSKYEFPGDDTPIVRISALKALEGDAAWGEKIIELMDAVDAFIPQPAREVDKPFLMPVEDVFTITGRGTVITGRIERGIVNLTQSLMHLHTSFQRMKADVTHHSSTTTVHSSTSVQLT